MAMQFLSALTRDPRVVAREKSAGSHLPYAAHLDDNTLITRDGLLMQFVLVRGLLFETAATSELNYRKTLRDAALQAIGSSRFALYHHVVRRQIDPDLSGEFPDAFSQKLDARWGALFAARKLYINDLYLTLVRRPLRGQVGTADRIRTWLGKGVDQHDAARQSDLRQLNSARDGLVAAMNSYAPRILGLYETPAGLCSEPLEFLSSLYNGETRPVLLPHGDIGEHLPYRRVSFGQNAIELAPTGNLERRFSAVVSVKDYAGQTAPGMFDDLLRLPFEMTISQSFAFVERRTALSTMNLAVRRMRSTEDEAVSLRGELSQAKDDVAAGRAGFGEHHMTIIVHGATLAEVDRAVAEVGASLADLGIIGVREDIALEPAYWAQFPANFKYIARRGLISTTNFAGLASAHNFAVGTKSGNYWGDAVTLLETTAAGPYFFNFHYGDLGNFTVIGPSGSGKTVVLNFLLAQSRKYDPRIIFFDKDRGAELFIRAIGGRYGRLHPDAPSGLNPLQLADTPGNRQFLLEWLTRLAGQADVDEQARLRDAIDANYEQPLEHRRLRHLVELFRGRSQPKADDLFARLQPWWGNGDRAWLFDNAVDATDLDARSVGFDMTAILDDPVARSPTMLYLFHRVEERLDGTPAIIVVDEGWKALDDEIFVRRIKDWEKTIRKRNGVVGFATQSARDALDSKIASAIIEQAATQIFMPNAKANANDYMTGFGLQQHEFDLVRTLPDTAHAFLIKSGGESVVVRLDLTGEQDLLTILSGRERTVRLLDTVRNEVGDDPAAWMPRVLEQA
jgi:type IV secretion system protein VirB4